MSSAVNRVVEILNKAGAGLGNTLNDFIASSPELGRRETGIIGYSVPMVEDVPVETTKTENVGANLNNISNGSSTSADGKSTITVTVTGSAPNVVVTTVTSESPAGKLDREARNVASYNKWQADIRDNLQFASSLSDSFTEGIKKTKDAFDQALEDLRQNTTDPKVLADYQARLAEYTMYRNAQSNTGKGFKDIAANTVRNIN